MGRFASKTVVVTGAAGGIGSAIAARFAAEHADLLLCDIDEEGLARVAAELPERPGRVVTRRVDVSLAADNGAMIETAIKHFGRLDVLVNNAAKGMFGRITDISPEDWRQVFAVGVDSIFYASRAALPHLARTRGSIVNVGSISGLAGDHGLAAYNSMKGAVANLTRSLAVDHAQDGVRVNAVAPGSVRTPKSALFDDNAFIRDEFEKRIPMRRRAEMHEVAAVVAFLASDDASYVNGINLVVDGGMTAATGQPDFIRAFASGSSNDATPR
jgi:meso-butanediol dehydrogenase/(S,S)-butanediol dehydrogenase/diacetyl reductase